MLKRVLVAVLVVAGLSSPASALRRVYVTNIGAGTVTVVDADRRTVLGVIEVGSEPDGVAVSPDGRSVYVANFADDTVSVIETATDSVVASIAVGDGPVGVAVSPDGAEVYVANRQAGTISIIDAAARTLVHEIPVSPLSGVNAVAFTPDGARALVTQSARDSVVIIDTATRRLVDGVRVGPAPSRIVVDPSGRRAYVSRFPNVLTSGFGSLVAIDLATLEVVVGPRIDRPTGLALSADARTVYVADTNQVLRVDAETLQVLGTYAAGSGLNGVIALGAPATVLVADTARDRLRFLPLMFGTEPQNPAPDTPVVTVPLEPFAIAAMPAREVEPLVASIDSPPFGFKLDVQSEVAVRITATAGELPLAEWTLVVRQDGVADQVLASGTAPASALDVVSLAGASFAPGASGTLVLTVTAPDSNRVVRQVSFTVTDHRYALVPLRGTRRDGDPRPEMDGAGRRFTRGVDSSQIELFDASTGITDFIKPRLSLFGTVLSRGGRRLGLFSPGSGTDLTGTFDLDTGLFSLVPYQFFLRLDLDAEGQWLTGLRLDLTFERYQLLDLITGERRFISDVAGDTGGGAACGGNEDQRPRISADGTVVAFVTGLDLGVGPSTGCRLFAYDRPSETLRLVAPLGDRYVQGPSLDDAGERFGLVLRPPGRNPVSERRAAVIDLASGAVDDVLGANPAQSFDAVLSGDGAAVIISSCADLDPAVGNPDRNNELFRFDLATRQAVQITDTRGGQSNCELLDGMAYDPLVSHDAGVVTFAAPADTTTGRQHSLRNDFAFGPVRAVSVIAGNTAPRYELIGATTRLVGEQFELGVRSGDRDLDPITFFAEMGEGGLPEGASFTLDRNDPQAGFYWQTGAQSIGEHILRLGIFDGRGGENIQYVRLTICRLYVRADDPLLVTSAIFDAPPASCGDADANGDAAITAADLVASRRRRI